MSNLHARRILGNLAYWDTHRNRIIDAVGPGVCKFSEDFVSLPFPSVDSPAGWTTTLVEAGSGESTVALVAGADGGNLLITSDANDNDGAQMQLVGEAFKLASGKPLYFGARLAISEATQSDFFVGLSITNTAILGGVSDSVGFRKVDATTAVLAMLEKNTSETTGTALTAVADTFYTFEFYFDGTQVQFYVDGVALTALAQTNLPDDEWLTPSIALLTGEAVVHTMTVDWVRCIQFNS